MVRSVYQNGTASAPPKPPVQNPASTSRKSMRPTAGTIFRPDPVAADPTRTIVTLIHGSLPGRQITLPDGTKIEESSHRPMPARASLSIDQRWRTGLYIESCHWSAIWMYSCKVRSVAASSLCQQPVLVGASRVFQEIESLRAGAGQPRLRVSQVLEKQRMRAPQTIQFLFGPTVGRTVRFCCSGQAVAHRITPSRHGTGCSLVHSKCLTMLALDQYSQRARSEPMV
ncbi:hypothetical protein ABH973_000163 [Bradyrhizobium ottawaense]